METENIEKFDVRTLVLKRWDASKTKSLLDEVGYQRGQYVSFQSYHFVDIIESEDNASILGTYKNIRNLYLYNDIDSPALSDALECTDDIPDTHVVQSIPLLGKSAGFWDSNTNILYITLIQLSDSSKWSYDMLHHEINQFFSSQNSTPSKRGQVNDSQWSLYYSLDYCDYVLFTKNIAFSRLNDLLWEMSLKRTNGFRIVRDTYTICSFGWSYLKDAFCKIEHSIPFVWDDQMALSMDFCVQDLSAIEQIKSALKEIDTGTIQFVDHRLPGRYDWNVSTSTISGTKVLQVLYSINSVLRQQDSGSAKSGVLPYSRNSADLNSAISEYQIVFLSDPPKQGMAIKPSHSEFHSYAKAVINKLYRLFTAPNGEHLQHFSQASYVDYARETVRSLYELTNSNFSEEFVLSVLPSLISFLRIVNQKQMFLTKEVDASERESIHLSCAKLQKNYFTALNTLSLCTMHNERQFTHSPAFNANYFNIPPKLLAYYSAIVYQIANCLKDTNLEQPAYNYIITPDYRTDIHVEPLNISYKQDTRDHLAIISLPEKYFYQPQKAIMLFAHEVGHYEGNRKRELRASSMFYLTGIWILRHTPLACCIDSDCEYIDERNLLGLFANAIGDYMKKQYDSQHKTGDRGIPYLSTSVIGFLRSCGFGLDYFKEDGSKQEIIAEWVNTLRETTVDEKRSSEISALLETLSDRDGTSYYCSLSSNPQSIGVCDLIARNIADHCQNIAIDDSVSVQRIIGLCENTFSLFSETYADMQMLAVLGNITFDPEYFWNILKEICGFGTQSNAERTNADYMSTHLLRYTILKRLLNLPCEDMIDLFQETELRCVFNYLQQCQTEEVDVKTAVTINDILQPVFCSKVDRKKWCESLCTVLTDYENHIRLNYKAKYSII